MLLAFPFLRDLASAVEGWQNAINSATGGYEAAEVDEIHAGISPPLPPAFVGDFRTEKLSNLPVYISALLSCMQCGAHNAFCSNFSLNASSHRLSAEIMAEGLDALLADTTSLSSSNNNTGVSDNKLLREGVFSGLKSLDISGASRCLREGACSLPWYGLQGFDSRM